MPKPEARVVRDVWVSQAVTHVPAHRIPFERAPYEGETPTVFTISCPPLLVAGGVAITRAEAEKLRVHPCVRCFDIKFAIFPPPAPPA